LDANEPAVWESVLRGKASWLAGRIRTFDFVTQTIASVLWLVDGSTRERAFRTRERNRLAFDRIPAPGGGQVRFVEGGTIPLSQALL